MGIIRGYHTWASYMGIMERVNSLIMDWQDIRSPLITFVHTSHVLYFSSRARLPLQLAICRPWRCITYLLPSRATCPLRENALVPCKSAIYISWTNPNHDNSTIHPHYSPSFTITSPPENCCVMRCADSITCRPVGGQELATNGHWLEIDPDPTRQFLGGNNPNAWLSPPRIANLNYKYHIFQPDT
ncbi:hypothetical protein K504DRAFT_172572 [Pleomassaria siparia CBS 279.74]|uniref:Uncharacterized protein n=1 Tax=Pleomassaria siparia CBS 279.74 TaxID=1314801 RepID=A0A6G1JTL5_9PLEO|nr:hypothetical protein K504DRAFT_172572 [Pleomassaria siparia CBS 279.74]